MKHPVIPEAYCHAICPHCGQWLCPPRDELGNTITCIDTGKDFVLEEYDKPLQRRFSLIPCTEKYWPFILRLRMDVRNVHGFYSLTRITPEEHNAFMVKHSNNYHVCLIDGGTPCGFIGEIDGDIRICVDAIFHGQGIGRFMLTTFLRECSNKKHLTAKIKVNNIASRLLFDTTGFRETRRFIYQDIPTVEYKYRGNKFENPDN